MKLRTLVSICLLFCLALPVSFAGNTYKWRDENGNIVYSQTPPSSGQYETVKSKSSGATRSQYGAPASQASTPKSSAPAFKDQSREREANKKVAAESAKLGELRKKNCKAAKSNLERYTVYRRFKNDKGEVVRMDDNERLKKVQESKDAIKEFCD